MTVRVYTRAAEAGHIKSQNNLAILYGKSGDWQKSYFWLSVADGMGATKNKPQLIT